MRMVRDIKKESVLNTSITATGRRGLIGSLIIGSFGLGLCLVAAANPAAESRTVKFADVDLSNPSGAHVIYRRIQAAAQVVCSYYFFATDTDKARCVRDATADAVTRINQPALSAVFNANNKTGASGDVAPQGR